VQYYRRQSYSYSRPWKPEISPNTLLFPPKVFITPNVLYAKWLQLIAVRIFNINFALSFNGTTSLILSVNFVVEWRWSMRAWCVAGCWLRLWTPFSRWSSVLVWRTLHVITSLLHRSHRQCYVMRYVTKLMLLLGLCELLSWKRRIMWMC
jgi:hypothetical protein